MLSSTAHAFLALAGWSIIPDLATQQLLRIFHRLSITALHMTPPLPSTPLYKQHHRYTFAVVVLGYLLYNLVQGARSMTPNFYQVLDVRSTVDDGGLKIAFRQFAKKNHPDRPEVGPDGEVLFIMVRDMFEALKDPVVRFAYERFGPDVLTWTQCSTTREYLRHGLMQSSGYHIVTGVGLLFWSAIGEPSPIAFWRYVLYASLFASEIALLLSPSPSGLSTPILSSPFTDPTAAPTHRTLLHVLFPQRVAYQHILFLHQLFMFLSVALSRVAPKLLHDEPKVSQGVVERIQALAGMLDRETSMMLHTELHSIHPWSPESRVSLTRMRPLTNPSEEIMETLSKEMENMVIEANIKKDAGPLRSVWEAAITKGRAAQMSTSTVGRGTTARKTRNFWEAEDVLEGEEDMDGGSGTLPSPVSPVGTSPRQLPCEDGKSGPGSDAWLGAVKGQGRLPSPRPSPPPPPGLQRRGSSYVRARSVSY